MPNEIAKAYVQIIPTTKGIKSNLESSLKGDADSAGKSAGNGFLSSIGGTIVKGAAALGASATAAVGALAKGAISGYADYEQLVGGVETLFKGSADVVQAYADTAFKTAGLSANQYMETVTGFSASLLQSVGGDTEKAASIANMAITDMADNANKMGSSMESIQNAYQGFAKQNYTMLDNLKLGYGGTKSEMERLLADATALSGVNYDLSSLSDVYEAIHVIQNELGVTGTTALEASTTISGSVASMKAAWQNMLVGIADDNANFGELVNNLISTIVGENGEGGLLNNILPRVATAMEGIGTLISELAPIVIDGIGTLVDTVLPTIMESAVSMVSAIGEGIISNFDYIAQTAFDLVLFLADQLIENADAIMEGAVSIIESLSTWIVEYSDVLIEKAIYLVGVLAQGIINNLPAIIGSAAQIISALINGIVKNIPNLLKQVPVIISGLVKAFKSLLPTVIGIGKDIVTGVWNGIKAMTTWFTSQVKGFFKGIVDGVKSVLGIHSPSKVFAGIGENMALGLEKGWSDEMSGVEATVNTVTNLGSVDNSFGSANYAPVQNNDDVVGVISSVGNAVISAIREGRDVYIDGRKLSDAVTQRQTMRNRAYGI